MFTIKNVTKDLHNPVDPSLNCVRLWEAKDVSMSVNDVTRKPNVIFQMPDGAHCSIDAGVVYVMNQYGKTVDTYYLHNSEWA